MQKITREYQFSDFKEAMAFLVKVSLISEKLDHHPDIHLYYNKLVLDFYTHSEKKATEKDRELLEEIEKII